MERYKKIKLIGEGSFGKVFKSRIKDNNELVAVKQMPMDKDNGIPFTAIRELKILRKNSCAHIIKVHDIIYESTYMFIVMDFMPFDLSGLLQSGYRFKNCQMRSIIYQILKAVLYLHNNRFIHRDIKSSNILLDGHGRVKLADFGLTREFSECMTNRVCTLWYRAPELLLGESKYTNKIDIWSIGCIMIEIMMGKTPFKGGNEVLQAKNLFRLLGCPSEKYRWTDLFNITKYKKNECFNATIKTLYSEYFDEDELILLAEMLRLDVKHRISAQNALRFKCMSQQEDVYFDIDFDEIHEYNTKEQKSKKNF